MFSGSLCMLVHGFFFFKQKTAYEMRISDWSSDVCSSDLIELVEVLPGGPVRDEVGVGDEHARGVGVGGEDADGLAGLHEQGFVVAKVLQRFEDGVVAVPVARGAADAAVDDEFGGVLGHFGVEVVLDHPVRGLRSEEHTSELKSLM